MKKNSIQVKIISSISLILIMTFIIVVFFVYQRQKDDLLKEANKGIETNSDILLINLKNLMLNGTAPIMVSTLDELRGLENYKQIAIYRASGVLAFSDYSTMDFVNSNQKKFSFSKSERIKDNRNENFIAHDNGQIKEAVSNTKRITKFDNKTYVIEDYFPIINEFQCMTCHGSDHSIRGVAQISISVAGIYSRIADTRNFLIIIAGIVVIALLLIMFFLLKGLIISQVIRIGNMVSEVGKGNFKIRVPIKSSDEIGDLSSQINDMIKGLDERFRLLKYVSKSTEYLIKKDDELDFKAEKKSITVLFSDIRGFTSYSESRPPEEVIHNLNKVLQAQTIIVEKFKGDIDKFIGDELMAVFDDDYKAITCAIELMKAVQRVDSEIKQDLKIGIGINTGEVIAGNIGSENRLEYAVIGDTVNLASRLCSFAGPGSILISENTYQKVKSQIDAKLVPNKQVKGKKEPVNIYIVKGLISGV